MRAYPVITAEILDRAGRLQKQYGIEAPDEDRAEEIAREVQEQAATTDPVELIRHLRGWVSGLDFGSPEGGAWFWAYYTVNPVTGQRVGNQFVAAAHAAERTMGDSRDRMVTIETTPGGSALSALRLDSPHVQAALRLTRKPHKHPWTVLADHEIRGLRRNPLVPAAIFTTYEGGRTHYHTNQLRALDVGAGWNAETLPPGIQPPGNRRHVLQPVRRPVTVVCDPRRRADGAPTVGTKGWSGLSVTRPATVRGW